MFKKSKPIKFPEDEQVHDNAVEWWYFNGNLEDKKGNQYAFMDCLFKVEVRKIKNLVLSKSPLKNFYFSHSIFSDIKKKKSYPSINYFSLVSKDSFSRPLLFINHTNPITMGGYVNSLIEETKEFEYHLKNENLDLKLVSQKKPLLVGGEGYLNMGQQKKTYYYSLSNLATEGLVRVNNLWIEVQGKSWMDHQWINTDFSEDNWKWFSLQLEDNTELVCFLYQDSKTKIKMATISYPDDHQEHTSEIEFVPQGKKWKNFKTGNEYNLSWQIRIPSKNITLEVEPLLKNQEMVFGKINYWEGPLSVKGIFEGRAVKGKGFMELVGYPSKYGSLKFLADSLAEKAHKFLSHFKK
jgi:predicted secreted hydrolase